MNQTQMERAVARVTGENLETIQRLGFSPVRSPRQFNPRQYPRPGGTRKTPAALPRKRPQDRA
jgi:hypothetical protein